MLARFFQMHLSPQSVEFVEDQESATLTLLEPASGKPITIEMDRQIGTRIDDNSKISMLVGSETIRNGRITNEVVVAISNPKESSNRRNFSMSHTTLLEGFQSVEGTLSGTLICPD